MLLVGLVIPDEEKGAHENERKGLGPEEICQILHGGTVAACKKFL